MDAQAPIQARLTEIRHKAEISNSLSFKPWRSRTISIRIGIAEYITKEAGNPSIINHSFPQISRLRHKACKL
jgi:hypothetical protein